MRPVEAVIFDYGGVISLPLAGSLQTLETAFEIPPGSLVPLLFGEDAELNPNGGDPIDGAESADPAAVTHDWHRLEVGAISFADYFAGVAARAPDVIGMELDFDALGRINDALPIGIRWRVVHEIRALHEQGVPLALLTNNVAEFGDMWRSTFPVDELFPIVVDSSEVKLRKPNPAIYELTCAELGVDPHAAVFLDDNGQNCDAATALGIEAIQVSDPDVAIDELRAVLARRGVVVTEREVR